MAREEIQSEVTGTVWKIECKVGDAVADGDTLMILESMKMEIPVISTEDGKVAEILVKEEEPVAEGQAVVVIDCD
ncbi:MAG: biotin/lipoyl-binding carrier protein [Alphaproteobacteria bacterium]|nr:biotin/lipoyl-binding carrier protein [Alphaproteobacteria bacterium]